MSVVRAAVCFVLLSLLLLGCRGEFHQFDQVEVRLALQNDTVEVLEVNGVEEMPNPPVDGESVAFAFHPDDGGAVVEGAVKDTRILRSEFDEEGRPDPRTLVGDVGLFEIRIPSRPGRLVLTSSSGEPLGEVDIDPSGLQTRAMPLLDESDVLTRPVKIVNHGDSSQKVDILFLPEGYTEAQMGRFHADVNSIVAQLSTHSGYREHWSGFNIWRQDVRSRTAGTGSGGWPADTAFDTAGGIAGLERCVFFATPAGTQAARTMAAEAGADATVVLVNSTGHGGCASGNFVVSARPRWVADVVGHELGHALFGLADEYSYGGATGFCTVGPNVSLSPDAASLPWADMLTTSTLPTPTNARLGTVGAFEGGGYCERGRYRPTHNCMMRTLGKGMCPVCRREVARTMEVLAPVSTSSENLVAVTNASGGDLWLRCDGQTSTTCTDWTLLRQTESLSVRAPGRRLVIHNRDIEAPVRFDLRRIVAYGPSVTIYANAQNPLTPAVGGGGGGQNATFALTAPRNLVPDGISTTSSQVALSWSAVDGATRYLVAVEVEEASGWRRHGELETDRTAATMSPGSQTRRYRWRVTACNDDHCASSRDAQFQYRAPVTTEPPATGAPTAPPAQPATFSPAHEATVPSGPVTLTWSGDAAATTWNAMLRVVDPATQQWRDLGSPAPLTSPSWTPTLDTPGTWYAWSVQACNSLGCSAWTPYSLAFTAHR